MLRSVMTPIPPRTPAGGKRGGGSPAGGFTRETRSKAQTIILPQTIANPAEPIVLSGMARRGGSSKTTTNAHLAFALAYRGYNVMVVRELLI